MKTRPSLPHSLLLVAGALSIATLPAGCAEQPEPQQLAQPASPGATGGASGADITDVIIDDESPDTPDNIAAAPPPTPWFSEEAAERGVHFVHRSGHDGAFLTPEIVAGGAALLDIDQDGWLDLYLVQSGSVTAAPHERPPNQLFRNTGHGRFIDITEASGTGDRGYGIGVATGDVDNDGFPDLYVTNLGPNVLLLNQGDGTFRDISAQSGTDHNGFGASAAFFDADRSGLLDLFVVNYLSWTPRSERRCPDDRGRLDYCAPTSYNAPTADVLLRNLGDGRFEDASHASGIASRVGTGLGIACADFDQNGFIDVFVANDGMNDHLWMNGGAWTFTEEALRRGCAVDESGVPKAGMGVVIADFTGNGQPDLLVCNLVRESDSLFYNTGGWFTDATARAGLATVSRLRTRFGIGAHDFDHDGVLDLFVANGRVGRGSPRHSDDHYAEPNLLLAGTAGGRFQAPNGPTGIEGAGPMTSRAAAFGDIDNDGAVDIVVVNRDGPVHILRNTRGDHGAWIMFRVLDRAGRDALHASVAITMNDADGARTEHRWVRTDSSYLAAGDPRVHVGLGRAQTVRTVDVDWPTGSSERFGPFPAFALHELREGSGQQIATAEPERKPARR